MKVNIKYQLLVGLGVLFFGLVSAASQDRRKTPRLHMPAPTVTGFAAVNNIHMYYAVYGSGEPVLLIHGGLENADIWSNQIAVLAQNYKVIVADSRGHGRTSRPTGPYTYDILTADYLALLDYLKIDKAAIIGSSDGGIIGINMAMHHPERVSKLFAQAANVTTDGLLGDVAETKHMIEEELMKAHKRLNAHKPQQTLSYDDFVLEINAMWYSEPNWSREQLAAISVPTVIAIGDRDEEIRLDHSHYIAQTIPGAKFVILHNSNHGAMVQNPEVFNDAVLSFLEDKGEPEPAIYAVKN